MKAAPLLCGELLPSRFKVFGEGRAAGAFSLVEVVLAIAVATTAIVTIAALLTNGLTNYSNSDSHVRAAATIHEIATCIQGASQSKMVCTALPPFNTGNARISWTLGSTAAATMTPDPSSTFYLDQNGIPTTDPTRYRMAAMVAVAPPGLDYTPGKAYIFVGWPVIGKGPSWSSGGFALYPEAQGHEELTIPLDVSTP